MNQPKTTNPIEAMKYALAALEYYDEGHKGPTTASAAIDNLRQAIEQAEEAKPYGWMVKGVPTVMRGSIAEEIQKQEARHIGGNCVAFPVYLHPPTAPAQPNHDHLAESYQQGWEAGNKAAPAQQEPVAKKIAECLAVLRPAVKGKWPHEQALEELARYTHAPAQPAECKDGHPVEAGTAVNLAPVSHGQKAYRLAKELADHLAVTPAQPFQPDWANYRQGVADGEAELDKLREAARLALDALEYAEDGYKAMGWGSQQIDKAIDALKEALK